MTVPTENAQCVFPISLDSSPPAKGKYDRLIKIITMVALIAFNCFVVYNAGPLAPWLWVPGFFIGAIFYDHVKRRITDVFNKMSWMWILPTTGILYGLAWPQTITMQAILTGLDMGSRWSRAGQWFTEESGKIFLCFRA